MDIKNAFGQIRKHKIEEILHNLRIPVNILRCILDVLHNRKIVYDTGNKVLEYSLKEGSPQGSPLSPIIWNLLIEEVLEKDYPRDVLVQGFADDITIVANGKSRKEIESKANASLRIIEEWAIKNKIIFNTSKCNFLLVGTAYQKRPPVIRIFNKSIQNVKELKILGIIFDTKLSFLPHLKVIQEKTNKITTNLARFSGYNWGLDPGHMRTLYLRAIERMIIYGCQTWYSNKTHIIRKLQAIQRIPLMKISRAFQTIPNLTLQIVTAIPPLHLTIEREIEVYNLGKSKNSFKWKDYDFTREFIVDKIDRWETHPAETTSFSYNKEVKETDVYIYTDGSENEKYCGAAYVVMDKDNKILDLKQIKLPEYSNNFVAETQGIKFAIEYIKTQDTQKRYQILTDSLSTLKGLENAYNTNHFIHEVKLELIEATKRHNIELTYVRGHQGNIGNDTADELAKQAARNGEEKFVPLTKRFVKRELRQQTLTKWNEIWNERGRDSKAYQWIKNVKNLPDHFPLDYFTTQAISEHGRFPFYFQRFKISKDNLCKCGQAVSNFDHYLDNCPITIKERAEIKKRLKSKSKLSDCKQEIIKNRETLKILQMLVKEINDQISQFKT